ncbi:hypothetical protein [Paenibacillus sp. SN-8-1]|uniref:hypothetical protein n=1 Tax=Paenibacillus sp. SN-8-1 TaxID=3435409 RepID=UPI003D9A32E9
MKVKELIEKLQEKNPEAEVSVITVGNKNQWEYTSNPKVTSHKNSFGETVWIQ